MSKAFAKIRGWLEQQGFKVIPGRAYCYFWEEKQVTYRPQDKPSTQVTGLLHECGHVLVDRTIARGSAGARFKRGYASELSKGIRPKVSAADLVHEEIEAWHRGFMLARRLRIRLDVDLYWKEYGRCIAIYFRRLLTKKI